MQYPMKQAFTEKAEEQDLQGMRFTRSGGRTDWYLSPLQRVIWQIYPKSSKYLHSCNVTF